MKIKAPPQTLPNGAIEPGHEVVSVCASCGYDLNESELLAEACASCGAPLKLKQSVSIQVTALPPIFGSTL
jgi:predicted amidophosphoribosyltransferase